MEQMVLESCHSTWVFDTEHQRFHRVLKGSGTEQHPVTTEWRPYYGLEFKEDSEAFVVLLNAAGTRLIQSWRHTHDCLQCGSHVTGQMSVRDIDAVRQDARRSSWRFTLRGACSPALSSLCW